MPLSLTDRDHKMANTLPLGFYEFGAQNLPLPLSTDPTLSLTLKGGVASFIRPPPSSVFSAKLRIVRERERGREEQKATSFYCDFVHFFFLIIIS